MSFSRELAAITGEDNDDPIVVQGRRVRRDARLTFERGRVSLGDQSASTDLAIRDSTEPRGAEIVKHARDNELAVHAAMEAYVQRLIDDAASIPDHERTLGHLAKIGELQAQQLELSEIADANHVRRSPTMSRTQLQSPGGNHLTLVETGIPLELGFWERLLTPDSEILPAKVDPWGQERAYHVFKDGENLRGTPEAHGIVNGRHIDLVQIRHALTARFSPEVLDALKELHADRIAELKKGITKPTPELLSSRRRAELSVSDPRRVLPPAPPMR